MRDGGVSVTWWCSFWFCFLRGWHLGGFLRLLLDAFYRSFIYLHVTLRLFVSLLKFVIIIDDAFNDFCKMGIQSCVKFSKYLQGRCAAAVCAGTSGPPLSSTVFNFFAMADALPAFDACF